MLLDQEEVVLVETLRILAPKLVGLVSWRPAESIGRDLECVLVECAHIHDQSFKLSIQKLQVFHNVLVFDLSLL